MTKRDTFLSQAISVQLVYAATIVPCAVSHCVRGCAQLSKTML